jgi:hypothetical protein
MAQLPPVSGAPSTAICHRPLALESVDIASGWRLRRRILRFNYVSISTAASVMSQDALDE